MSRVMETQSSIRWPGVRPATTLEHWAVLATILTVATVLRVVAIDAHGVETDGDDNYPTLRYHVSRQLLSGTCDNDKSWKTATAANRRRF